jgi:hypothetical protein
MEGMGVWEGLKDGRDGRMGGIEGWEDGEEEGEGRKGRQRFFAKTRRILEETHCKLSFGNSF